MGDFTVLLFRPKYYQSEKSLAILLYFEFCFRFGKQTSTGNMLRHLKNEHKIEAENETPQQQSLESFGFSKTPSTTNVPSSSSSSKKDLPDKKLLTKTLTRFYLNDSSISMAAVTSNDMLRLLQDVQKMKPIKTLPVRQTLSNNICKIYKECETLIKLHLKNSSEVVAVMLDLWTDKGIKLSYLNISVQYSINFEIHTICLAILPVYEKKTKENLRDDIIIILKKFGLETKFLIFVTDNGANILAAIKLVIGVLGKGLQLSCILHCIHNLIYSDVLKESLDKLHKIHRKLVYRREDIQRIKNKLKLAFVYKGFIELCEMDEIVEDMTKPVSQEPIKISMATRWNSLLNMLKSTKENHQEANIALSLIIPKCPYRIMGADLDNIDLIIKLLEGFAEASVSLQSSTEETVSTVALFKASLEQHVKTFKEDLAKSGITSDSMIGKIAACLSSKINQRMEIHDFHKFSSLLDPSNIVLGFSKEMTKLGKRQFIESWYYRLFGFEKEKVEASSSNSSSEPSVRKKLLGNLGFDEAVEIAEATSNKLRTEITRLLNEKPSNADFKIWWEEKKHELPTLYHLADVVFGIPASSAFAERCFSIASRVASEEKSNTLPRNVEQVCFCRINKKLIQKLQGLPSVSICLLISFEYL